MFLVLLMMSDLGWSSVLLFLGLSDFYSLNDSVPASNLVLAVDD